MEHTKNNELHASDVCNGVATNSATIYMAF